MYPLLFDNNLHITVWGGRKLRPYKGLPADDSPTGESWEVSAVPGSNSTVINGTLKGKPLEELCAEYGERLLGRRGMAAADGKFPLLVKFIDAATDLSIQVHPDNKMAWREHKCLGKAEMWYVMAAEPGGRLLIGMDRHISPREFEHRIKDDTICDVIRSHEVKPGDVFFIPAGRIHAICGGVMVAEVQQSSDITYRLYDYSRKGLDGRPRQLHIELGTKAVNYKVEKDYQTHYTPKPNAPVQIAHCKYFNVNLLQASEAMSRSSSDTFIIYTCMKGGADITAGGQTVSLDSGHSCLIPAEISAAVEITPKDSADLLEITI